MNRANVEVGLQGAIDDLRDAGVSEKRISTKIIEEQTSRASCIVEEASTNDCDTIVVGRRGLTAVEDFFAGRVSKKIFQLAEDKAVWIVS